MYLGVGTSKTAPLLQGRGVGIGVQDENGTNGI